MFKSGEYIFSIFNRNQSERDEKPFRYTIEPMKDTIAVEASTGTSNERNTLMMVGARNEYSGTGETEERIQEGRIVHSGLEPEGTGKTFVVQEGRGPL